MSLLDVNLKQEYRSPRDNIVNDFYIPLLKEANLYKRSVGFFSSSSLLEISYGITHLINNNEEVKVETQSSNQNFEQQSIIDNEKLNRIVKSIIILENNNVKTRELNDEDMKKK